MTMRGDRGIYFGAGIETRGIKKDVDEIRREILSLQKVGAKMDLSPLNEMMDIQKKAIADLERQYKSLGDQIGKLAPGKAQQQLVIEHRKVGAAIEAEKQALEAMNEAYKSFGDEQVKVRTRQREIRHELYALAAAGKDNTAEFRELVKELQGFDSAVDSVKALQNTLRSGGVEMKAFVGTVRAGTGVFATMTGFMGLFAEQNERFAQIQTRLQSVLSISMGIEQTYNALLKEGQLIQSVRAIQARAALKAKQLETKSTISATIAQRAYNAVAKANPYVILAGAILSVVGALALMTSRNRDAAKSIQEMNEKIAEGVAGPITQFRIMQEEWKRLGDSMSERQRWIDENKSRFDQLGVSVNNVGDAETVFIQKSAQMVKAFEARAKAAALQELATDAYKEFIKELDKVGDQIEPVTGNWIQKIGRGIASGAQNIWAKMFDIDQPIDKAEKALDKHFEYIKKAADFSILGDEIIKGLDLSVPQKAEKKVTKEREKTFKESLDARKQMWENYYEAVRAIGKKAADKIYKDDIGAHESYLRELEAWRDKMLEGGITTQKEVEELNILNQAIQELLKLDSPFEKQRKDIERALSEIDTFTDKLKFLKDQSKDLGTSSEDIKMGAYLREQTDAIVEERQRMFDELMKAHQSYEQKVKEIDARTSDLLAIATTPEQIKIIEDQAAKEKYDAYIEMLKDKYEDLNKVFTDIAALSREKLIEFREIFEHELSKADDAAKKTEISKVILRIDAALRELDGSPIKNIVGGLKDIKSAADEASKASGWARFGSGLKSASSSFKSVIQDVEKSAADLGITMDSVFGQILKNLSDTVNGIDQISKGADQISEALKKSDPIGRISGITSIVSGAIGVFGSWLNSTEIQGKELKKVVREVEKLKRAYEDLEKAIEGTVSTGRYDIQAKMLESLRSQQEALRKAIEKETSKWLLPIRWDKVMEWDAEIGDIEKQIEELVKSIQDDLLTIDASGIASRLGDALVEAFERGESASESLNEAINNIYKTMIRNSIVSALQSRIQPVLDNMLRSMGIDPKTGELTMDEVKQLSKSDRDKYREQLKEIAKAGESILEGASDLFRGIIDLQDEELADPLRGAIKGMSQETADVLAGQFNAIRMDTSGILTTLRNNQEKVDAKVIHLANIDANTARMYKEVKELNEKIKEGDVRSSGL